MTDPTINIVAKPIVLIVGSVIFGGLNADPQLQAAHPITRKLPLCVFGGLGWTAYDLQRVDNGAVATSDYTQLQAPLGISLGKEFKLTDRLSVTTFAQNAVLYQFEKLSPAQGFIQKQHTLGIRHGRRIGVELRPADVRSTISNYKTLNNGLGLYDDFPYMSLQLGVKF